MTDEARNIANQIFCRQPTAPIGPDGKVLKTSVCDEIEASVRKAAEIEQQLARSKVTFF